MPSPRIAASFAGPSVQVRPGDVDVELTLLGAASGWVDVDYDPGVLVLADVTSRYEPVSPGRVRVYVDPRASSSATLTFSASAHGAQTVVRLVGGASIDGTPLALNGVSSVEIRTAP